MILTMTKYHENLLRDSPLSLLSIVKLFSSLEAKKVLKMPNITFLRITRYKFRNSVRLLLRFIGFLQLSCEWLVFNFMFTGAYIVLALFNGGCLFCQRRAETLANLKVRMFRHD